MFGPILVSIFNHISDFSENGRNHFYSIKTNDFEAFFRKSVWFSTSHFVGNFHMLGSKPLIVFTSVTLLYIKKTTDRDQLELTLVYSRSNTIGCHAFQAFVRQKTKISQFTKVL